MTVFSIEDFLVTDVATSVIINVLEINLYTQATVRIHFVKSNGEYIKTEFLTISGDDYKKWNDDDSYLLNLVFNKYGIKKLTNNVVAEATVTDSDVSDPVVTEPVVSDPVVTDPVVTDAVVTEGDVSEHVVTEGDVSDPVVSDSDVSEPVITEPAITDGT